MNESAKHSKALLEHWSKQMDSDLNSFLFFSFQFIIYLFIYLSFWLHRALVAALGIFSCSMQTS